MELVDTHCHLTEIAPELREDTLKNASGYAVAKILCVGAADGEKTNFETIECADTYENVWASVGIHPHDARTYTNLKGLESLFEHTKVRAIGETGLDFYRDWAPRDWQIRLFENTISVAKELKKPLIIHCRDAKEDTLRILRELKASEVGGVFHCFAGDADMASEVWDLGFLISFTGVLTFKNAKKLREAALSAPLEQIMLETDTPYMAPEPYRGQRSEPKHVYDIAVKLAEIRGVSLDEVAEATTRNANRLFGI